MTRKKKHPLLIKNKHGGRLSQWVLDELRAMDKPKDRLIQAAVIKQYKMKPPKIESEG